MNTINLTKNKRPVYTSHANNGINDLRIMNDGMAKTQTFGTVLAESKQERRLLNHEKHCKIWDKRSQILSKKWKRSAKSYSLLERSDQFAVKIQELDQLSKVSKPWENTDSTYQWICSLRTYKGKDKNRQIFLPLSNTNPINSCITARVNPFKKEEPIFLKIITKKSKAVNGEHLAPKLSKLHQLDITKKKGYIKDLKDKIINKKLKIKKSSQGLGKLQGEPKGEEFSDVANNMDDIHIEHLKVSSPRAQKILNPDRIENLASLYVNGDWKFNLEYNYAKKRGTAGVEMILDHIIDNSGVGEPDESQEIIEENYNPTI